MSRRPCTKYDIKNFYYRKYMLKKKKHQTTDFEWKKLPFSVNYDNFKKGNLETKI